MKLALALCLAVSAAGENLLANPSFEQLAPDGTPIAWSAFVMPQAGAFAEADPLARDGSRAAMLHVPNLYEHEPANNWSQVVLADVADQDLVLTASVRTEGVGEAAVWLQCFSRDPARVVAGATTSATTFLAGTNEWTPVEIRLHAPIETEFVVVRCVIKGRGSAWFDAMDLRLAATATPDLPAFEPEEPAEDNSPEPTAPPQDADLLELSQMLNQAIQELEANNQQILERVQRIQKELDATRAEVSPESAPLEGSVVRHPLVPHGWTEGEPK